jgi:hypothetical protein
MADKTEQEWTQDVIRITTEIRTKFPELIKYIEEMPVNINNAQDNYAHDMQEYYESLVLLVKNYQTTHIPK